jgi:hypothetical protein
MRYTKIVHRVAVAALFVFAAAAYATDSKNVLFYGNSFTLGFGSTRSVNALFHDIAVAAGHDEPLVQSAAASGQDLGWHLQNNIAPIYTLIPPDQDWDFVVMQEHSTKLTRAYATYPDSVAESMADATGLYQAVATRSPNVTPVLYETWARGPGHSFYQGSPPLFQSPSEMQAELRTGYHLLEGAIDTAVGSDLARIAAVGDAWENGNWDNLHAPDLWHAQNRGTLLAALMIYGTVYEDLTVSDIDLTDVLASLNLSAADGAFLTHVADVTLPEPTTALLLILGAAGVRRR